MYEGVLERIKKVIQESGLSVNQFASEIGFKQSNLSQILSGKRHADNRNLIKGIADTFNIKEEWLLYGTGEEGGTNEILASGMPYYKMEGLPLIPISAMAGALSGSGMSFMEYECERYIVPIFKGADFLIRLQGDSMMPKYMSGDIVACQRVALDRLWFQWGKTYVIDTRQGALVKRIEPSDKEGFVSIHSENPLYKPFDLPADEINGVALVKGIIRVE